MDFKKKLKTRLYLAIGYIGIGLIITLAVNIMKTENQFLSPFGIALIVCGIVRIRNYVMITKNDETIRKQQIAETDERNISISNRAKQAAFVIYIYLTGTAVIVLRVINKTQLATILSASVCGLIFIYWVSYWIIRRKS